MKKWLLLSLALGLIATGCVTVEKDANYIPLGSYASLSVSTSDAAFLAGIQNDPHYDGYVKTCKDANDVVGGSVQNWVQANFSGHGTKPLRLVAEISEFKTGSGAARFFLGDVANGYIVYHVRILDGTNAIYDKFIRGEISASGSLPGMEKLDAYRKVARQINNFIKNHT